MKSCLNIYLIRLEHVHSVLNFQIMMAITSSLLLIPASGNLIASINVNAKSVFQLEDNLFLIKIPLFNYF